MKFRFVLLFFLVVHGATNYGQSKAPVDYVDLFMGTSESRWFLNPGVTRPFGMVQLSPDNQGAVWKGGYEYSIHSVMGFSHIHSWTMAGLSVMPNTNKVSPYIGRPDEAITTWPTGGHGSRIDKGTEVAEPGYYSTELLDQSKMRVELTSTKRAGFFRFTLAETDTTNVLFNLLIPAEYPIKVDDAKITKVNDSEIQGYSKQSAAGDIRGDSEFNEYTVYFVARFSRPFDSFNGWVGDSINNWMNIKLRKNIDSISGMGDVGAYASFSHTNEGDQLLLQTGISLVSIEQARLNLNKEIIEPFGWDFEEVKEDARSEWNGLLSRVKIEDSSENNKKKFYTNFYRSYVGRTTWSDVNGKYRDPCNKIKQLEDPGSPMMGGDAFWNTFWNLNQLWALVTPKYANDWSKSFLQMYKDGGWLPKGPAGLKYSGIMVASHSIPLIVGNYQKGITDFDTDLAWEAMVHQQSVPGHPYKCGGGMVGNKNLKVYMDLGYVPMEEGPVSNTLEYAYDDWAVGQFGKALNKEGYEKFLKRSLNYRNVFDKDTGYVRPKRRDGSWRENFDPTFDDMFGDYVEGNAWQYTFFVPHDMDGLIQLMGKDKFNDRLDYGFQQSEVFNFNAEGDQMGHFYVNHGNQPNMQASHLFNYSGKPWLTQKWTREIQDKFYGDDPYFAWPGDEDQGQMGAYFVMTAMGLFQMDGGASINPYYEINSPLFEKTSIALDANFYSGKNFTIIAKNVSEKNRYIQSAELNGEPIERAWIFHSELIKGGVLKLQMGDQPNKKWGLVKFPK